jgi:hypothetical protein
MKDKVGNLIAEWEDVSIGTVATTAARTAAIISAFSNVPDPVCEALGRLDQSQNTLSETRPRDIFVVVQYLRSLL